jgi:pimeloyl-ACP methyl ester carboxylesterase
VTTTLHETIRTQLRRIDGLSIRYAETDDGALDNAALLLSPWPESVFAYESTWARLGEHAHLVAVDLPGFGQSERSDPLLSPCAMGEFIIRIADAFGLEHPHVVGPDVGTSASLFAAAFKPDRLRSVTVGSGGAAFPIQLGGALRDWVLSPDIEPLRAVDSREIVTTAINSIERNKPSDAAFQDYLTSYAGDRFFEATRYVRKYPEELPVLATLLPTIATPVQVIAGKQDTFVPPVNAEYLHERLPSSTLELMDAGHFFWEEAHDEFADLLIAWWNGGYSRASGGQRR